MAPRLRVLIIDDSPEDAAASVRALVAAGFGVRAERVCSADALTAALDRESWDLAIADYSLRGLSGIEALQLIRRRDVGLPFVFVSGTPGEEAAVDAMKAGADDYVRKGGTARLVAAVRHEVRGASARRERRRQALRVAHLAYHDALTDLPNRVLLHDRLAQAMRSGRREGAPVSALVVDLDGFKAVNDTYGHRAGDRVLQHLAARLRGMLRDVDTVARLGGDEFAIVLPGADVDGAVRVAGRVLEQIQQPCPVDHRLLAVRGSVGIAGYPAHARSPDQLLQKADLAMYLAKADRVGLAVYLPRRERDARRQRLG